MIQFNSLFLEEEGADEVQKFCSISRDRRDGRG